MKIITQLALDEFESLVNDIPDKSLYEVNPEIYSFFLDLDEVNFAMFIEEKYPKTASRLRKLDENTRKVRSIFETSKFRKEFNETRQKFYLLEDQIYAYTWLGHMNVGHVIEVVRLEP